MRVVRLPHRARRVAIASLVVLCAAGIASASGTQRFKGKVHGGGPVTFQLSSGKVKRFQASMTVSCVSLASASGGLEDYVIAPAAPAKVDRHGRFKFKLYLPKQQFADDSGKILATLYSVRAEVKGTVTGRLAKGTAKVSYNRNELSGSTIVIVACASGKTPTKWSATRQ